MYALVIWRLYHYRQCNVYKFNAYVTLFVNILVILIICSMHGGMFYIYIEYPNSVKNYWITLGCVYMEVTEPSSH